MDFLVIGVSGQRDLHDFFFKQAKREGNVRIFVVPDPLGSEPLFTTDWISW